MMLMMLSSGISCPTNPGPEQEAPEADGANKKKYCRPDPSRAQNERENYK